jgi:hypothetical protein
VRADDIAVLLDYCEGRGKFSEIDTYVGMESSNRTMLLPDYIFNVDSERQRGLLESLVEATLGRIPELEQYVALLAHALMMLVISGHSDLISFAKTSLEEGYVNDQNVKAWGRAIDNEVFPKGVAFKETWHYALMLGRILHAIDSTTACRTTVYLREHAVSSQLRTQMASLCP